MQKFLSKLVLLSLCTLFLNAEFKFRPKSPFDLTVVGSIKFADGLGRLPIGFIDQLKDSLKINFISTRPVIDITDVPKDVKKIIVDKNKTPGNVSILFDPLWYKSWNPSSYVPKTTIKIAYSMLESTEIPSQWVDILNTEFDLVVVPAEFLIEVYEKSGVTIPIFYIPHGIYIENFLKEPLKTKPNKPFVFGTTAGFWPHKNHTLLLEAFIKEFKNNKNIKLKLHGRFGDAKIINNIKDIINKQKITNVELITESFNDSEYTEFMKSLDCYVLISKGEGFSVTPREALALGIPSIICNNTAHDILCKTPFVKCIKSELKEPADYRTHFGFYSGFNFNCEQKDVQAALRSVYENYEYYLKLAQQGRSWVKQYLFKNLKNKYLNLFKPETVNFGKLNIVTDSYLMTNSWDLYKKYKIIKIFNET